MKARVLKSVTPKVLKPGISSSPPRSSLHFRSKAAALSTTLMSAKQEVSKELSKGGLCSSIQLLFTYPT